MTRRGWTVLVGAVVVILLAAGMSMVPVPYVAEAPGYTVDTLGKVDNKPIIDIKGTTTYTSKGHLNMTTVSVLDGVDLVTAIRYWFDKDIAVVPRSMVYPPGESKKKSEQESAAQFEGSQSSAETAALRQLGYPTQIAVTKVDRVSPLAGQLAPKDVITQVNDIPITSGEQLAALLYKYKTGGGTLTIRYHRGDVTGAAQIVKNASESSRRSSLGFSYTEKQQHDFSITFDLEGIGGPSAGLMFALAIIDKLTSGDLTGGRFIAGTGEIAGDGKVSPIGGITQKLISARRAGATVFLTPKDNCQQARQDTPSGLRLIKVSTLKDARESLKKLADGTGTIPSCKA